jgi:malonyl-CoA/methylmalonyl-CoA synthetase
MAAYLYDLFARRAPSPAKVFIETPDGRKVSYGDLEAGAARVAGRLVAEGVEPGDRVALQAEKSADGIMIYLGVLKAGAVFLPLNNAYTSAEVDYFLKDAEPRVFITDPASWVKEAMRHPPLEVSVSRTGGDLASLIYTSGTTGRSKGAMLSHGSLAANALALHEAWGFTADDVLLHALPVFHVHGLFVALHCALLSGCPMVWLPRFADAEVLAGL